ncbi:unnamed protein product [Arabidopsis thaliana]|uniref:(thale cress) hypothetical protein n=1 Tax=Arabidopsis thaliana TaxID=3702 RepID=A0A7G2DVS1_ARATH|nr:unnamed protein product [Arabidopsis thaliana]
MAFATGITTSSNPTFLGLKISNTSLRSVVSCNSISFPSLSYVNLNLNRRNRLSVRSASVPAAPAMEGLKPAISLSENALKHLKQMQDQMIPLSNTKDSL